MHERAILAAAIALVVAGCADDDDSKTNATPTPEQQVERAATKWARVLAAGGPAICRNMTQPGCESLPPVGVRRSFAGARVEDSAIRGKRALASFSNGEVVELSWVNGYAVGGVWWVHKVRGRPTLEDVDREAGVRFALDGRVLSVRLLASATRKTRHRVSGERIRATCGEGFASSPGPGPLPDPVQTRTRLWPAARAALRYRLPADISHIATWCRLEDPVVGHVAFVKFR